MKTKINPEFHQLNFDFILKYSEILMSCVEFKEIYCFNCKKTLGRYNEKYFSDLKMGEIIKANHSSHVHEGHDIVIRKITV
jgi:hypothetical protein